MLNWSTLSDIAKDVREKHEASAWGALDAVGRAGASAVDSASTTVHHLREQHEAAARGALDVIGKAGASAIDNASTTVNNLRERHEAAVLDAVAKAGSATIYTISAAATDLRVKHEAAAWSALDAAGKAGASAISSACITVNNLREQHEAAVLDAVTKAGPAAINAVCAAAADLRARHEATVCVALDIVGKAGASAIGSACTLISDVLRKAWVSLKKGFAGGLGHHLDLGRRNEEQAPTGRAHGRAMRCDLCGLRPDAPRGGNAAECSGHGQRTDGHRILRGGNTVLCLYWSFHFRVIVRRPGVCCGGDYQRCRNRYEGRLQPNADQAPAAHALLSSARRPPHRPNVLFVDSYDHANGCIVLS